MKSLHEDFLLSIVIPVYNEQENIASLLKKLLPIVSKYRHEIIFVDDGSSDDTVKEIKKTVQKIPSIKLIAFTRNFGHQMALTAGYQAAGGDCVVSLDADLQDPPELIDEMIDKWSQGLQIVYGKREERDDHWFKKLTAHFFYQLMNFLSDTPVPADIGDFRLLDRKVVDFLNQLPEQPRFLRGLVAWGGYKAVSLSFRRNRRLSGQTHYPLSRMVNFALEGITSFSTKPLKLASYLGFFTSTLGFIGIVYALYRRFVLPHEYWVTGWTALFVAIMFFGGIQLLTIGIIGEYIGKIYQEVRKRPRFLIKEKLNF